MAVAEGLTIITYKANEEFFKDLLARPHTIVPDALAKAPQPLKLVTVDDTMTMKDAAMEVQLYHLRDNPREGTNLFAYVPRERILVQADLYDSTWQFHHWGENVITNIEKIRKLKVDKQLPIHGSIQSYREMVKTSRAKKTARTIGPWSLVRGLGAARHARLKVAIFVTLPRTKWIKDQ